MLKWIDEIKEELETYIAQEGEHPDSAIQPMLCAARSRPISKNCSDLRAVIRTCSKSNKMPSRGSQEMSTKRRIRT